jgi:hypothetical protein
LRRSIPGAGRWNNRAERMGRLPKGRTSGVFGPNFAKIQISGSVVRVKGLEPPLPYGKQILSLPRLPFRHTRISDLAGASFF